MGDAVARRAQRAAIPTALPVLPGLHVDAEYASMKARGVGRTWFDVLALADGRAAMLVGDVLHPDIPSAAVAGRVRPILAQLLSESHDLVPVLEQVNQQLRMQDERYATSACMTIVDPSDGRIEYGTCGHAPPLIVEPLGGTRHLPPTGGGALGLDLPVAAATGRLGRDGVLVLSSGITRQARAEVALRLAGLSQDPDASTATPGGGGQPARTAAVCHAATEVIRRTDRRGGLAVLAAQHRPAVPRLKLSVPAIAANVDTVREAVGNWLFGLRSSVEDGAGMTLAVGEATANAVQHAYVGGHVGTVTVEASLQSDGELACWVRDDGRWLSPELSTTSRPGRGLAIMARLCDRVKVSREGSGTVVELRRRLHHPVIRSGTGALSEV